MATFLKATANGETVYINTDFIKRVSPFDDDFIAYMDDYVMSEDISDYEQNEKTPIVARAVWLKYLA